MHPWERRFGDLTHLLKNCAASYLDPDLFRMNTNQFLQTSRTISFLIAKNKANIPGFDAWHKQNILAPWSIDPVMRWAKEARNHIEKEGDLDLYSTLRVTLLFSYLESNDIRVEVGRQELLGAGIKKLVRLSRKYIPTGVSDAAVLKVERRWTTASLPTYELLHALTTVHSRVKRCCIDLARHLGETFPEDLGTAPGADAVEEARGSHYIRVRTGGVRSLGIRQIVQDPNYQPPETLKDALARLQSSVAKIRDPRSVMEYFETLAQSIFEEDGYHIPTLIFFDDEWRMLRHTSTVFDDQVDKFIFWRSMAEQAQILGAKAAVWISESWLRKVAGDAIPIHRMPIKGELLQVVYVDATGLLQHRTWKIVRDKGRARLEQPPATDGASLGSPFFLVPIMKAMGIDDPQSKFLHPNT